VGYSASLFPFCGAKAVPSGFVMKKLPLFRFGPEVKNRKRFTQTPFPPDGDDFGIQSSPSSKISLLSFPFSLRSN